MVTNKEQHSSSLSIILSSQCQRIIKKNESELYNGWADFNNIGKALKEEKVIYKDLKFLTLSKLIVAIPNVETKVIGSKKFARLQATTIQF